MTIALILPHIQDYPNTIETGRLWKPFPRHERDHTVPLADLEAAVPIPLPVSPCNDHLLYGVVVIHGE